MTRTSTPGGTYPIGAYVTATTKAPHRGAIRCGDDWRTQAETLWICEDEHPTPQEATGCAAEELDRARRR